MLRIFASSSTSICPTISKTTSIVLVVQVSITTHMAHILCSKVSCTYDLIINFTPLTHSLFLCIRFYFTSSLSSCFSLLPFPSGRAGAKGLAVSFFTEKASKMASELVVILREANQDVPAQLESMRSFGGGGGGGRYGGR